MSAAVMLWNGTGSKKRLLYWAMRLPVKLWRPGKEWKILKLEIGLSPPIMYLAINAATVSKVIIRPVIRCGARILILEVSQNMYVFRLSMWIGEFF